MKRTCACVVAGVAAFSLWGLAVPAWAQARSTDPGAAIQALRQAIFEAEDRRAPTDADLKVLLDGVHHPSEMVQRMAVRALGRLERPALVGEIEPMLHSRFPSVRAAAADALGQAVASGGGDAAVSVQAALLKRLGSEGDAGVIAAVCWTLGRLPYSTAQAARTAEVTLLIAALPLDSPSGASLPLQLGVAREFEALLRRQAKLITPSQETSRRLAQMALDRHKPRRPEEADDTARVRRLAMAALGAARLADEAVMTGAAADPDAQVRRLALMALAAAPAGSVSADGRARLIAGGLADPDSLVRYEALRIHARSLAGGGADWAPVFATVEDPSPHVALMAIDLLWGAQPDRAPAADVLRREAGALPAEGEALRDWHRAAHAMVSLARLAPEEATTLLPRFEGSRAWPVRMYAARAAALLRDVESLKRLARDERDNVREAAISGLKTVAGHEADSLYFEALGRPDYQLAMTAADALVGTPRRVEAVAALGGCLDDFDPRVAAEAAGAIGRLTGQTPGTRPRRLPAAVPRLGDIERLRGARAVLRIAARGTFEIQLMPDEAPATVARFVALARSGYYNGLTFHRVVPGFIVQGGSPGANEYAGDAAFMRDEIGLEPHVRGSAGISTRGRDTGDAQIWFDLVDNPRLVARTGVGIN